MTAVTGTGLPDDELCARCNCEKREHPEAYGWSRGRGLAACFDFVRSGKWALRAPAADYPDGPIVTAAVAADARLFELGAEKLRLKAEVDRLRTEAAAQDARIAVLMKEALDLLERLARLDAAAVLRGRPNPGCPAADGPCCEATRRLEDPPGTLVGWVCGAHGVTRYAPAMPPLPAGGQVR